MISRFDWKAIRDEYEEGRGSLAALSRKHGVSRQAIKQRAVKEHWVIPPLPVTPPKNPVHTTRDINAAVQAQTALRLYLEERPTWDEIAARCGYSSRGAAHNAVQRELDRCITHDVKELRTQELYRLEQLQARCYREAIDPKNKDWTWVTDRFVALSKRKSELMGMDKRPDEDLALQNYTKKIIIAREAEGGEQHDAS